MAGSLEHVVVFLSFWVFRAVVIISLGAHLFLVVFSGIRRREAYGFLRNSLWLAYQLSDWAPTYVLGNLYLDTSPREKLIVAFWSPFLLLHLARPDNISAYDMEDHEISLRIRIFVPANTLGAIYVWYRYIYMDRTAGLLRPASGIMLFLGIYKYLESTVALWLGDLGRIRESCEKQPSRDGDDYKGGEKRSKRKLDDEKALLFAHELFYICKCAFSDYPVDVNLGIRNVAKSMFLHDRKNMYKVVEMELSLMYDIMYTKAAVIHTWCGYFIRVASPLLTAAALVLFGFHCTEGQKIEDIYITYILLGTTLFLDVKWLLSALASTWTHSFFKARPQCLFNHEVLCRGRWQQLRRFVLSLDYLSRRLISLWTCAKEPKSYRLWSGNFGQHNLLYECTGNRGSRYSRPVKKIESEGSRYSRSVKKIESEGSRYSRLVKKIESVGSRYSRLVKIESEDHSRGLEIPDLVKKLLFENIGRKFFPDPKEEKKKKSRSAGSTNPWQQARFGFENKRRTVEGHPDEEVVKVPLDLYKQADHWKHGHACFTYDQVAPPDLYKQADYWRHGHAGFTCDIQAAPPDHYKEADHWRPGHAGSMYDQAAPPDPNKQDDAFDKGMDFVPDLQEVILIWHIATDIFLHNASDTVATVSPEYVKAIKAMSGYMVFLVAVRPNMLPGPKLRSLYEDTRDALKKIMRCKKAPKANEKELAMWMLRNKDLLKGQAGQHTILWEGTQHAEWLLRSGEQCWDKRTKKFEHTMKRLAYWIPELMDVSLCPRSPKCLLEFILDSWERLLIYGSIKCSREAHAKQLSHGGELTTVMWILSEHTNIFNVKKNCYFSFEEYPVACSLQ